MAVSDRGFASMDRKKQREIAAKGGRSAHNKGTAHEWTPEEAKYAGMKGGLKSGAKKRAQKLARLAAEAAENREPQSAA